MVQAEIEVEVEVGSGALHRSDQIGLSLPARDSFPLLALASSPTLHLHIRLRLQFDERKKVNALR